MGKKIALNVFYNLGIILSIFGIVWGYNNTKYLVIGLFVITGAFFLYLKLQLVKEMRSSFKNRK
ncbi:MAG: DUF6358 family protein [Candidatus Pedobacter colombiensis]|uniref:DUF6358 family protein n=1 Tax=Candidatus Pedobacter colombiensis TaxID=3121371 RepID=A0AAJ5W6H5_9SPHI|nr:DUF6358 family protein [Pedobacter sp.]WEK19433.1 MAG: DUF6358 family protein [Pedobacter sp.]